MVHVDQPFLWSTCEIAVASVFIALHHAGPFTFMLICAQSCVSDQAKAFIHLNMSQVQSRIGEPFKYTTI